MIYALYIYIAGSISITQWPTMSACEFMAAQFKAADTVARCIEVPK